MLKLEVEEMNDPYSDDNIHRAYKLLNIENWQTGVGSSQNNSVSLITQSANVKTISDLFTIVKSKDGTFTPKPVDLHFLNADGTPRVFYHGTNEEFSVFDKSKSQAMTYDNAPANWFTSNSTAARSFRSNGKVMEVFLSLCKPLVIDAKGKWYQPIPQTQQKRCPSIPRLVPLTMYKIYSNLSRRTMINLKLTAARL